jgi:thioredoxin reductase
MSCAIIGLGKIGQALAKAFARKGLEVSVATTREPKSFAPAAAAIGPKILAKKLADAGKAAGAYRPLDTSRPGIFAVNDVRAGSTKRVASAAGEGSVVAQGIYEFLVKDHRTGAHFHSCRPPTINVSAVALMGPTQSEFRAVEERDEH